MRTLFADTFYWAAMLNARDQWHQEVKQFNRSLRVVRLVTTDEVITEFLNFFSGFETVIKQGAAQRAKLLLASPMAQVIPQSRVIFWAGLRLYEQRLDKGFSLTGCISMETMKSFNIRGQSKGESRYQPLNSLGVRPVTWRNCLLKWLWLLNPQSIAMSIMAWSVVFSNRFARSTRC
jgi:predicted nucleic acid-binding protein